ncbi:MAG: 16S rRNA (uracil(1498)-N(3))-methyltransferase [Gammaproteobacteria bacterium]
MRIPRVYVSQTLGPGARVALDERAAGHVARVLRLRAGAELIVFDGNGGEYVAVLREVRKGAVVAELGDHLPRDAEPPVELILAQGISRSERMSFTLQKAVELGVSRILPLWTERSQVRLSGERLANRIRHWEGVVISACEQCGRTRIPVVECAQSLTDPDWSDARFGTKIMLDPKAAVGLRELNGAFQRCTLLAGPEGGLSGAEHQAAVDAGFTGISLGPRVLRTETAALAALAAIQALWGDLC